MIPIPMEDASFDFSVLDSDLRDDKGQPRQRILLVAAHREMLRTYMSVLAGASLEAVVMDASPLALLRAVPVVVADPEATPGVEVIVSIGADLTTVAVRQGVVPRFIRSLSVCGSRLTDSLASTLHMELAMAERVKRESASGSFPNAAEARRVITSEMRDLAEEVRGTIDFFVAQAGQGTIERLLITGGASQAEGVATAIAGNLPTSVMSLDPLAQLDTSKIGYSPEDEARIGAIGATAIGLALWNSQSPLIRLSVLPDEVQIARRARRILTGAGVGLVALAGVLGVAGAGEIFAVHSAQNKTRAAQADVTALTAQVNTLTQRTAIHAQVAARQTLVTNALQGDIDWVRVVGQMSTVIPDNLSLGNLSLSRTDTSGAPTTIGGVPTVGTLNTQVKGSGGLPSVTKWLQGLNQDLDVTNVGVSGITVTANGGNVTFSSTMNLTTQSRSDRSKAVSK
jgi:type IV pilus assembly protein PilM